MTFKLNDRNTKRVFVNHPKTFANHLMLITKSVRITKIRNNLYRTITNKRRILNRSILLEDDKIEHDTVVRRSHKIKWVEKCLDSIKHMALKKVVRVNRVENSEGIFYKIKMYSKLQEKVPNKPSTMKHIVTTIETEPTKTLCLPEPTNIKNSLNIKGGIKPEDMIEQVRTKLGDEINIISRLIIENPKFKMICYKLVLFINLISSISRIFDLDKMENLIGSIRKNESDVNVQRILKQLLFTKTLSRFAQRVYNKGWKLKMIGLPLKWSLTIKAPMYLNNFKYIDLFKFSRKEFLGDFKRFTGSTGEIALFRKIYEYYAYKRNMLLHYGSYFTYMPGLINNQLVKGKLLGMDRLFPLSRIRFFRDHGIMVENIIYYIFALQQIKGLNFIQASNMFFNELKIIKQSSNWQWLMNYTVDYFMKKDFSRLFIDNKLAQKQICSYGLNIVESPLDPITEALVAYGLKVSFGYLYLIALMLEVTPLQLLLNLNCVRESILLLRNSLFTDYSGI